MILKDQLGRELILKSPVKRIVSLVPSQTELLHALGLEEEVVGITKFCVHPEAWYRTKCRVGGTKQVDIDKILSLEPDLILANKEENTEEIIQSLEAHVPVWISDIYTIEDALHMIEAVGTLTNKMGAASQLITDIKTGFDSLFEQTDPKNPVRVKYYIWKSPDMLAGTNTFINAMITRLGFVNCMVAERYPEDDDRIIPDVILLSTEPYPFKSEDIPYFESKYPNAIVKIVDGEMFSWYGSRMILAATYLRDLRTALLDQLSLK